MPVELTEQQLWILLKEGDENAFEMTFKQHYQTLCNYAYSFLQDRDEAEEIVQATFLNIWEKRHSLDVQTSLKSYLYRAVRNTCLNAIKHNQIKRVHVNETLATTNPGYEPVSQSVTAAELDSQIALAMEQLPEQCKLIFKMSRFEELKYAEIADHLNISIKTVENQIGKALKIMREQLKDYLPILFALMNGFI